MKSINEEIKQKTFSSNLHMATVNLFYTANVLSEAFAQIFKKYDILEQHFNILRIVSGKQGKPITPGEIIDVMLNKNRDLTRLVAKLTRLQLLNRMVNPDNRRKVNIEITEKGKVLLNEINAELEARFYAKPPVKEDEAEHLSHLLDKIRTLI